jgi:hypothetical protein
VTVDELWERVEYGGHTDHDNVAQIPPAVTDLLRGVVGDLQALKEGLQNLRELMAMSGRSAPAEAMSRADALRMAREHVEAMSTNARGFQDGVKLADKVAAVDAFARFLMGEVA